MNASNVFRFDFAAGKMVSIAEDGLLPVGQIVTYSDMANPRKEFVVIGATNGTGYGQECIWIDGPTSAAVDAIADQFQECDFDGMDDSTHYRNAVFPELFGGAKYVNASRCVSEPLRAALDAEMGIALTFDKWGRAEGFRDYDQEQHFNRTLHARDFLMEPLTTPEAQPPVEATPEPTMLPYCPVLCW